MQVERGKETQVRGNKRAGKELIGWDAHWERGGANEADMRQVWRKNQTWDMYYIKDSVPCFRLKYLCLI